MANFKFLFKLDLIDIQSIDFFFSDKYETLETNPILTKRYPTVGKVKYGAVYVPVTDEEVAELPNVFYAEAVVNFNDNTTLKAHARTIKDKEALLTTVLDGDAREIEVKFHIDETGGDSSNYYTKDEIDEQLSKKVTKNPEPMIETGVEVTMGYTTENIDVMHYNTFILEDTTIPFADGYKLRIEGEDWRYDISNMTDNKTLIPSDVEEINFTVVNNNQTSNIVYTIDYTILNKNDEAYIKYADDGTLLQNLIIDGNRSPKNDITIIDDYYTNRCSYVEFTPAPHSYDGDVATKSRFIVSSDSFKVINPATFDDNVYINDTLHLRGNLDIRGDYDAKLGTYFVYEGINKRNLLIGPEAENITADRNYDYQRTLLIGCNKEYKGATPISIDKSFILGDNNGFVSGTYNVNNYIFGDNNIIKKKNSFIIGLNNTTERQNSYLIGENLKSNSEFTNPSRPVIIMGAWNDTPNDDDIFVVGNGYDTYDGEEGEIISHPSTALSVNTSGDLSVAGDLNVAGAISNDNGNYILVPKPTAADAGKVLKVNVSGEPEWVAE